MAADDPDPVDELFALAPEGFTAERDALVRRLRADGDREAAAAVKALRRPTVAAWALNQVVRRHRDEVEALVRSGSALAEAQQAALGGSAAPLREATRARSAQLRRVTALALEVLGPKAAEAHRSDVVASLTAASTDPSSGARLVAGRLSEALDAPTGFTFGFGVAPAEPEGEAGAEAADDRPEAGGPAAERRGSPKAGAAPGRRLRSVPAPAGAEATGTSPGTAAGRAKGERRGKRRAAAGAEGATKGNSRAAADAEAARVAAEAAARAAAARQAAAALRAEADEARTAAAAARRASSTAAERVAELEAALVDARAAAQAAATAADDLEAAATVAARAADAAAARAGNER